MATIVLDSNILIYFIENDVEFGEASAKLMAKILQTGTIAFSCLALTELHAHPQSAKQLHKLQQLKPLIIFYEIDEALATLAGTLRSKHKTLKTPDALHLATALHIGATQFITNDHQLQKLKITGLDVCPLNNTK